MFNIQQMMQKAQVMQKKMAALQEELAEVEVSGSAGGGLVQVVMTCKGAMRSLTIDPSLIDPNDKDMLEDMIKAACNDARAKADEKMATETQKAMSDMGLPPGMLGNGGLAAFRAGRPVIVRLGWEANNTNSVYPWRVVGDGLSWRDCFRRWVDILDPKVDTDGNPATPPQRTGRFRIVWNMANKGTFEYPINNIWPGNDYVDIVGSEFYDRCPTVKNGDEAGWRLASNGRTASGSPVGPVAWLAFARSKGKKYAVPEWGIGGPNTVNCGASQDKGYDNPFVVRKMFEFFSTNAAYIAYENYFNHLSRPGGAPTNDLKGTAE